MVRDRYENPLNQAPETDPLKQKKNNVSKTDFNRSRKVWFQGVDGLIMPFDHFYTLPGSSEEISYNVNAIMTNPYAKKILTGKRGYVKVWFQPLENLWEGAKTFIKKGRDYQTQLKVPVVDPLMAWPYNNSGQIEGCCLQNFFTAASPSAYLGLSPAYYDVGASPINNIKPSRFFTRRSDTLNANVKKIVNYDNFDLSSIDPTFASTTEISALPFVMYQQIYAWNFMPKNLVNDNVNWLPVIENHFLLSEQSSGHHVRMIDYNQQYFDDNTYVAINGLAVNSMATSNADADEVADAFADFNSPFYVPWSKQEVESLTGFKKYLYRSLNKPWLLAPRFCQFKGNMFNSGSPFEDLIRGDIPTLDVASVIGGLDPDQDVFSPASSGARLDVTTSPSGGQIGPNTSDSSLSNAWKSVLRRLKINISGLDITLNRLRALTIYSLIGEQMARTDGTYKDYINKMFGVSPNTSDGRPRFLGGFYFDMQNSEVIQTSETGSNPLGTMASYGKVYQNGYVGKFQFDDYGIVMATLHIVNEEVYEQGVDREWSMLLQEQFPTPLNNELGPIAIKTSELYLSNVGDTDLNNTDFNYVERDSHWKSRRNRALGFNALPSNVYADGKGYIQARRFSESPVFNSRFVTMTPKNVDREVYTSVDDFEWQFDVSCNVDSVLPLPYVSTPLDFGSKVV